MHKEVAYLLKRLLFYCQDMTENKRDIRFLGSSIRLVQYFISKYQLTSKPRSMPLPIKLLPKIPVSREINTNT